jgi:Na+-transporting NADH:ubiquinone oxidoreductase subunit NqrC
MTVKQDSTFSKKEVILMVSLAVVAMVVTTVAVVPSLRTSVKEALSFDKRNIIAKVSGKLTPEGPNVTVLKIQSKNSLDLEIYDLEGAEGMSLMAKIPLAEGRDGYFSVKGNATNLTLIDVDNDGTLEVVAPAYDDQMVPRLNIYKFNPATRGFDKVSSPEEPHK